MQRGVELSIRTDIDTIRVGHLTPGDASSRIDQVVDTGVPAVRRAHAVHLGGIEAHTCSNFYLMFVSVH